MDDAAKFEKRLAAAWRKTAAPGGPAEPAPASAEAADGRVRVTAVEGRVTALELDPRLKRVPAEELAGLVLEGINAALDGLRTTGRPAAPLDPAAMLEALRTVEREALRTAEMISEGLADAMRRVSGRADMRGDPGLRGLDQVLADVTHAAENLLAASHPAPDDQGAGEAGDGLVRAVAGADMRVRELVIDPRGMKSALADLADLIRAAVNTALDDSAGRTDRRLAGQALEPDRLHAIQRQSLRQMTEYTRAVTDLMLNIAKSG